MNSHPELKVKVGNNICWCGNNLHFIVFNNETFHLQAQFGTLSDYFNKIWEKTGVNPGAQPPHYPTLGGDFFTYADR